MSVTYIHNIQTALFYPLLCYIGMVITCSHVTLFYIQFKLLIMYNLGQANFVVILL